ncbi:hypothetical protein N0V83_008085 [Neocucurbitaria cava]|uniref:Uncharacterized protein n=1 Tax=Neocucurbitaria cava TaxID=798079 RepID=A0A9W9CJ83_9PLEO|nr:hypothetical protein N0V83_008085 [Neocucurbitaria cava]
MPIGIGVGVVALIALLIGLGVCFWRIRGKKSSNKSRELPVTGRKRSASHATQWSMDNDQKTLVASFPTSPYNAGFHEQHIMAPGVFAKTLERNASGVGNMGPMETEKSLPLAPTENPLPPAPTDNPLPPAPTEQKRYALNVNISKSTIFDEDMIRAVSPLQSIATPRERAPKYRFEEYLPPVANTPPISITLERPGSTGGKSEYELERFPNQETPTGNSATKDDGSHEGMHSQDPRETTLSTLESKAPTLSLPDFPPASPGLSFRSYDWYQDILDPRTSTLPASDSERKSTILSAPLSLSPRLSEVDPRLVPQPLSPGAPPPVDATGSGAASSSTNSNFRLSPTVYRTPSRTPDDSSLPSTYSPLS